MKTRIEVDEMGRHILILPEDIVEEYSLEDGDTVVATISEDGTLYIQF